MGTFVDFGALKARVKIEQVVQMLGLMMKQSNNQLRSCCPACKNGGDRALVVTPSKEAFYCFGGSTGGDLIALAAHIQGVSVKEAAAFIADRAGLGTGTNNSSTSKSKLPVPESDGGDETQKFAPLSYLQQEHQAVDAIGFSPEICEKTGIGFAPKGILRGLVAIPIRDERGNLLGYIGITDAKLPANFTTNVVELRPKTA